MFKNIKFKKIISFLVLITFLTGIVPVNSVLANYLYICSNAAGSATGFSQISAGYRDTLMLKSNGDLYSWGANLAGEVGDGSWEKVIFPAFLSSGFSKISSGNFQSVALTSSGDLYSWGMYGGDGTGTMAFVPVYVGTGYSQIAAGHSHGLAIKTTGDLYAWGDNSNGALGIGSATRASLPVLVGSGFAQVTSSYAHTLALKTNGDLYAWGDNTAGQIGDGTTTKVLTPKLIGSGYSQISTGADHSLALKSNGDLYAWGSNGYGQLGDGTTTSSLTPKFIGAGYTQITSAVYFSAALKANGDLYSWGNNSYGQLGDYATVNKLTPTFIASGYKVVSAGGNHLFGIKSNGDLYAAGHNYYYFGEGTTNNKPILTYIFNIEAYIMITPSPTPIPTATPMPTLVPTAIPLPTSAPANNTGTTSMSVQSNQKTTPEESSKDPQTNQSDPINTASGAQLMDKTLLSVNGAIPLGFSIQYNSLLLNNGVLGKAWFHNYQGTLVNPDANNITINWGSNNNTTFLLSGSVFQSTNPNTPYDSITKDASSNYILKKQDGSKNIFDSTGKMTEIDNRNGQKLLISYDTGNKLISVTEPISDKKLTLSYDTSNRISKVNDDLARSVNFTYDANNNLTSIKDAYGYTTTYTLNASGQIISAIDSEGRTVFVNGFDSYGRISSQTDSLNSKTSFAYDEVIQPGKIITTVIDRNGNMKKLTHDNGYHLLYYVDETGKTTKYDYDSKGNRIQVTDPLNGITKINFDVRGNVLTSTNALNNVTTFTYDTKDNLTSVTDAYNKVKNFTYDTNNNLLTETDSLGNVTNYTYDANGLLLSKKSPEGGISSYTYTNGKVSKSTDPTGVYQTFTYDAVGRTSTITNAAAKATSFIYDNNDNIIKTTNPLNQSTQACFDGYGNKLTSTDANGKITNYTYNANGKITSITDPLTNKVQYSYDGEDRLTKVTDALGNITSYVLDAKGRKIQSKDSLSNIANYAYDDLDRLVTVTDPMGNKVATNSYDSIGNVLSSTDALARVTAAQYDTLNRVTQSTNPLSKITKMFYDNNGSLISVTDAKNQSANQTFNKNGQVATVTDLNSNVTTFKYDAAGRLTSRTNSSGKELKSNYNNLGQVLNTVNGRAQTATFTYDDAGRIKTLTDPVGAITYSYDVAGNITSVVDSKGTISYVYDILNRVTQFTDVNGNVLKYSYNANSNLKTLTYPDNKVVTYDYDTLNRLTKVTDWASRVTTYAYDANSRIANTSNPDGSTVYYTYDAMGQLLYQSDRDKNMLSIGRYKFDYDAVGNIKSEKKTQAKSTTALTTVNMAYGLGNQETSFNSQALVFDADGNMTTGPVKGVLGALTYDARNRLLTAGGLTYDYDSLGNRIAVTEAGVKTTKVINPLAALSQTMVEKDATGNIISYYVYGMGLIGMQTADGNYYTYHYDRRGSTVALTKADGTVTDKYTYGPFGELLSKSGTTRNQMLYDGRDGVVTDNNGLYYMRARYYSQDMKRFVNEDTVLGGIMNGQSLNRFAYVNGNPVMGIDPTGHVPVKNEAGNINDIMKVIVDIEKNNPNLNPAQILTLVSNDFESENPKVRYVYTSENGWIDFKHFFKAADMTNGWILDNYDVRALGLGVEILQLGISPESAFSYEDLSSNKAGAIFGDNYVYDNGLSTGEDIKNLFGANINPRKLSDMLGDYSKSKLNPLNPQDAPNWNNMPGEDVGQSGQSKLSSSNSGKKQRCNR